MNFTVHQDPRINKYIEQDLSFLRKALKEQFPNITALILTGGFGRGEGSLLWQNGLPKPINDYDIVVLFKKKIDRNALRTQSVILAKQLAIRFVDLLPINEAQTPHLPYTQFNYDLSQGNYTFYGDPQLLSRLPTWDSAQMPLSQGKKILFNRLVSLLEGYSTRFLIEPPTDQEAFFLANQCSKAILACVDALLMLKGHYHYSYQQRYINFSQDYTHDPESIRLVKRAVEFKLRPQFQPPFDVITYWFYSRDFFVKTLKHFLNIFYEREFSDWVNFDKFYRSRIYLNNGNTKGHLKDLVRLGLRRPLVFDQIINLDLAQIHLSAAIIDKNQDDALLVNLARERLRAIQKNIVQPLDHWEDLRAKSVSLWYQLKH